MEPRHQPRHRGLELWVRDLNRLYAAEPALHELDFDPRGFEWIDCHDADHSIVSLERRGALPRDRIAAVFNFTPVPRSSYLVGVDFPGEWVEVLNSDGTEYGGSGVGNRGRAVALAVPAHGRAYSLSLTLPPLGAIFLKPAPDNPLTVEADAEAELDAAIEAAMGPAPAPPAAK
jgi:1,4-alpha-glucan branching enzyme